MEFKKLDFRKSFYVLSLMAMMGLMAFIRFYDLPARPMHNDEAVNSWFLKNLVVNNTYKYDPDNYHGPLLYYVQLLPTYLTTLKNKGIRQFSFDSVSGITEWSIRFGVVVFSLMLLALILMTRNRLGTLGAFTAFLWAGLSCDMLYFSRYFIHEMFFVFFTLVIYWGMTKYIDTDNRLYLNLAIIGAVCAFCTKETVVITLFVLLFSVVCVQVVYFGKQQAPFLVMKKNIKRQFRWFWERLWVHGWLGLLIGFVIWLVLFSSFFTNLPQGLIDSFAAYLPWLRQGVESGHEKHFFYFIADVLFKYEWALVVGTLAGLLLSGWLNNRSGLYLSFWTLGMIGAYSIIPYKTPWCVINMLLPMALLSGWAINTLYELAQTLNTSALKNAGKTFLYVVIVIGALIQLRPTLRINFVEYDSDSHVQAYVHTNRDVYNLIKSIQQVANRSGHGAKMVINVVSEQYWPIPFYLKDFPNAQFWGQVKKVSHLDAPVIVANTNQQQELSTILKDSYVTKEFSLRSNLPLIMYTRKELSEPLIPPPSEFTGIPSINNLSPGLTKKVWFGRRFNEDIFLEEKRNVGDFEFSLAKDQLPYPVPFSITWTGYLKISEKKPYTFSIESDDGSELWIHNHLIIDNGTTHALEKKTATVTLSEGVHPIELRYFDMGGQKSMRWSWMENEKEKSVPYDLLFSVN